METTCHMSYLYIYDKYYEELSVKGAATENLGVTHVYEAMVYRVVEYVVNLVIEAAHGHVENPTKPPPFYSVF